MGHYNQHWQHKYNTHLWFHFTPAQLAAWSGKHTASVGLREDGWVDFGASARRSDGKQDGGGALELTVRVAEEAKLEVMREIARQMVSEAREAVESAAYCGEQVPQWVQQFMSPAGWQHYRELRKEAGDPDKAPTAIPELAPRTGG